MFNDLFRRETIAGMLAFICVWALRYVEGCLCVIIMLGWDGSTARRISTAWPDDTQRRQLNCSVLCVCEIVECFFPSVLSSHEKSNGISKNSFVWVGLRNVFRKLCHLQNCACLFSDSKNTCVVRELVFKACDVVLRKPKYFTWTTLAWHAQLVTATRHTTAHSIFNAELIFVCIYFLDQRHSTGFCDAINTRSVHTEKESDLSYGFRSCSPIGYCNGPSLCIHGI